MSASSYESERLFNESMALMGQAITQQQIELQDPTITLAEWAAQKKLAEATIINGRSYSMEAERRLEQMLWTLAYEQLRASGRTRDAQWPSWRKETRTRREWPAVRQGKYR